MNKRRVLASLSGAVLLAAGVFSAGSVPSAFAAGPEAAKGSSFDKDMEAFLAKDENVKKVGDALERYFQKKREEAQQQAAKSEQERMDSQFKNPVTVDLGDSPVRGEPSAKVTIVEFSDFQCPFCQRGSVVMEDVLKEYPKDVKVVFKNLPLPFHDKAKPAAKAALAAGKQGKFWEMHDLLFKNQASLGEDFFVKAAGDLQLDVNKFKADMASPEVAKKIDEDTAQAQKLGVNGTPGFFVNGVLVSGAQPLPAFKAIIDRWLKS
ncbi:MAG: thioredoxin domain-containing protein [Bdellovibrionota bacterium]